MIEIKKIGTNVVFWHIVFFAALGLFVGSSLTRIQQSVAQDELHWLIAAKSLYLHGIPQQYTSPDRIAAFSPHLYLRIVVLAFSLFGESEVVARLPGVISGLLAIIMVFLITKSFSQGDRAERVQWAALSSLLYASTPATIQGSLIIDIDNTILIPAVLFLYGAFVKYQQTGQGRWAILTGLSIGTALWARVTTPIIITFLLFFYVLVKKNTLKAKLTLITAILSGVFLFVVSWYLYCSLTGVPFREPFTYTLGAFQSKVSGLTFSLLLRNLIFLTLWLGVFPSLLFVVVTIQKCKRYLKNPEIHLEDIFLWSGGILILGYTLVGGAIFGYPKYHSSAIPLLYIFAGLALSQSKSNMDFVNARLKVISVIIIVFIASVVQTIIVGDLLYGIRYELRNAFAFMLPVIPILKSIALKIGLFSLVFVIPFMIYSKILFKKAWMLLLILLSVGTNIGTVFIQNTANYHTGYNYGGQGTIETAQYIREKVSSQSVVLAPSEIIYYLKLPKSLYLPNTLWTDTNELRERLTDKNTSALVYSIATNTIHQIRTISTNKAIQDLLSQDFDYTKIGSYVIWIRKDP